MKAAFLKLFDSYIWVARIFPALLILLPAIWTASFLHPAMLYANPSRGALASVCLAGLLYFFGSIARSRGKAIEPDLYENWGGKPTTMLLRHADRHIDKTTKKRYHVALAKLARLRMPTVASEKANKEDADEIYGSAVRKLMEKRRGPKFSLVHSENASYGFRRNLYGLKPLAISISLIFALVTLAVWFVGTPAITFSHATAPREIHEHGPVFLLLLADVLYAAIWLFFVTRGFVFEAGKDYAVALLRTLDN